MRTAAEIEAHVLANDNGIGLGDGLVAVEGHEGRGNEVLGLYIRLAHPPRALDEIAGQALEPRYFDGAVRMKQVAQLVPLRQVAMHPPGHQVGNALAIFQNRLHLITSATGCRPRAPSPTLPPPAAYLDYRRPRAISNPP